MYTYFKPNVKETNTISFLDVGKINKRFETEFQQALQNCIDKGRYIFGDSVALFEKQFAAYCGTQYCVGTGNGLDALTLILKGYINLGKLSLGDEVLVPANTYIGTILSITNAGLVPILVDAEEHSYTITLEDIVPKITPKTKAIVAVHLYGQMVDMREIMHLVKKHNLLIFEDAAQAHGALNSIGMKSGNLSDAAAFSFYPSKNFGCLGDGGAVTTNDKELATIIRKLSNYGASSKYIKEYKGINSRLDELQAAFLSIKLPYLDEDNERRRQVANYYLNNIDNDKINLPKYDGSRSHVFHQFVIRCEQRDALQKFLKDQNIETSIHYPIPPHKQKAYKELNNLSFPVTEKIHDEVLSLPISPVISHEDVERIVMAVNAFEV